MAEVDGDNQALRETWLKDLAAYPEVDYRFFHGVGPSFYPDFNLGVPVRSVDPVEPKSDVVILDAPDDYWGLIFKSQELHRWGYQQGYDFVLKVDADTYVNMSKLMASGFEKHDYYGHVQVWPGTTRGDGTVNQHGFLNGGEGYWTSRRACEIINEGIPRRDAKESTGEDQWTGDILGKAGIVMVDNPGYGSGITLHGSLATAPPEGYRPGVYKNEWMYQTYEKRT